MNEFIHPSKQDQQDSIDNAYYTVVGQEDFLDTESNPRIQSEESNKVLAKRLSRSDGTYRYMVKLDRGGKIYNPLSIYGENQATSFLDRVCRSQNKFKDVNLKAFGMYLNFLKTKNTAWLHNTEREI